MSSLMASKKSIDGIFLLDKPRGMSSNAALQNVKRLFCARKAGHTGSLDPLATGMLPICFGEATKFSQYLLDSDKTYLVQAELGVKTTTGDAEGQVIERHENVDVSDKHLSEIVGQFLGPVTQLPSMYSAIKYRGKPLYRWAREGVEVERKTRQVQIYQNELLDFDGHFFSLKVKCSKGTYIRTLVEDIGDKLGVGAHVTQLRRISTGPYKEDQMMSLDQLSALVEGQDVDLEPYLLSLDTAVMSWPAVNLNASCTFYIRNGQAVRMNDLPEKGLLRLFGPEQQFLGIGEVLDDGRIAPRRLIRQQHGHKN